MNFALIWQLMMWATGLGTALMVLQPGEDIELPVNVFITWQDGRRFVIEAARIRRLV